MREKFVKYILLCVALLVLFVAAISPSSASAVNPAFNQTSFGSSTTIINLKESDPSMFHVLQAASVCQNIGDICVDQPQVTIMPIFKKISIINKNKSSQKIIINDRHDFGLINTATIRFEVEHSFFQKLTKQIQIDGKNVEIMLSLADSRPDIFQFSYPVNGYESTQDFFYTIGTK